MRFNCQIFITPILRVLQTCTLATTSLMAPCLLSSQPDILRLFLHTNKECMQLMMFTLAIKQEQQRDLERCWQVKTQASDHREKAWHCRTLEVVWVDILRLIETLNSLTQPPTLICQGTHWERISTLRYLNTKEVNPVVEFLTIQKNQSRVELQTLAKLLLKIFLQTSVMMSGVRSRSLASTFMRRSFARRNKTTWTGWATLRKSLTSRWLLEQSWGTNKNKTS